MDGRLRANQPLFRAPGRVSLGLSVDCGEIWAGARRAEQRRAEFGLEGQPRPAPPRPGPSPGFALLVNGAVVRGCGVRSTSSSHHRSRHAPSDQRLRRAVRGVRRHHTPLPNLNVGPLGPPPRAILPPPAAGKARPGLRGPQGPSQTQANWIKRTPQTEEVSSASSTAQALDSPAGAGARGEAPPPAPHPGEPRPGGGPLVALGGGGRPEKTHTLERRSQNLP